MRGGGGAMTACLGLFFLLPGVRRRRPALLAGLLVSFAMLSTLGCTTLTGTSSGAGLSTGTPTGTLSFTISTTGTQNGVSTNHDAQFLVTVQ